ncbi:hypothetical protein NMY22_g9058 [Coprinellus aureogranulatus]|nr:hypothetical protein NMY22_g9058 [Coprinellus aureogranulatus]
MLRLACISPNVQTPCLPRDADAPPEIDTWDRALKAVEVKPKPPHHETISLSQRLPPPRIFMNSNNANTVLYAGSWAFFRNPHLLNVADGVEMKYIHVQEWRYSLRRALEHLAPSDKGGDLKDNAVEDAGHTPSSAPTHPHPSSSSTGPSLVAPSTSLSSVASSSSGSHVATSYPSTSHPAAKSHRASTIAGAPSSTIPSSSSLPAKPSKKRTKKQQEKHEKRHKPNPYLETLYLPNDPPKFATYFGQTLRLGSFEELERSVVPLLPEIMWEVREGAWRLELMALDQALARSRWPTADEDLAQSSSARHVRLQRETLLRRVFPARHGDELGEVFVSEIPTFDRGLAAYDWRNRHGYLIALRQVMLDWEGCPDTIVNAPLSRIEISVKKLENALADFYCKSFHSTFGRSPVVPCRLPYNARIRDEAVRAQDTSLIFILLCVFPHTFTLCTSSYFSCKFFSFPAPSPSWMSFKAPRRPRLSAATPLRRKWAPARGDSVKAPRLLRKMGAALFPQVDVTVGGQSFAQRRPRRNRHSLPSHPTTSSPSKTTPKNSQQIEWERWEKLLVDMIPTYLNLLQDSSNLRSIKRDVPRTCACDGTHSLVVTVYGFDDMHTISVCPCSAGKQLLQRGYFPSAPLRPTVAFDIKMLEFARELYLRSSPNRSAWTAALESFLLGRGYIVTGVEKTRRKFAKSARYHALLLAQTEMYARRRISFLCSEEESATDDEWLDGDTTDETALEYLALCCPLCFGAVAQSDELAPADVVICIDACFTHKRRKPTRGSEKRDPPFRHPRTVFITDSELHRAKLIVESSRPRPAGPPSPAAEDSVEDGMKLPESVLNGCSGSFVAADETRIKASTGFFIDTGLMAVLCRHDRPLFLATLKTPGEQQFYAIALIIKVFESIPSHWTVGILYDIGCQLHRSCVKWDFIPDYIDRIIWGISVFHAYGHQWPCQLVYHPRKCSGFGLSDGEGCERFWSSIQGLIPSLRMSGYHQRLLSLDFQIWFLNEKGLLLLASWLDRKWTVCMERRRSAQAVLDETDLTMARLQELWDDQVSVQTKPLTSATAGLAKASIQEIMRLKRHKTALKKQINKLDSTLSAEDTDTEEAMAQREKLVDRLAKADLDIRRRSAQLGVSEKASLKKLEGNQYLKLRMQARAKKERLQTKLRERKFQLDRSNRVYAQQSASERRLQNRIRSSATKHSASIPQIVKDFNKLCDAMQDLIRKRSAPRNVKAPDKIDLKSIYSMDVDDPIWNYRGLDDNEEEVPLWLGDEDVRNGINSLLMWQRCEEEECYLAREAFLLQTWYRQEWDRLNHAIGLSNDWGPSDDEFSSSLLRRAGTLTENELEVSSNSSDGSEMSEGEDEDDVLLDMEHMHLDTPKTSQLCSAVVGSSPRCRPARDASYDSTPVCYVQRRSIRRAHEHTLTNSAGGGVSKSHPLPVSRISSVTASHPDSDAWHSVTPSRSSHMDNPLTTNIHLQQHGIDTYLHFIQRPIVHPQACSSSFDHIDALAAPTSCLLVRETQRLARDPFLARRFRHGVGKGASLGTLICCDSSIALGCALWNALNAFHNGVIPLTCPTSFDGADLAHKPIRQITFDPSLGRFSQTPTKYGKEPSSPVLAHVFATLEVRTLREELLLTNAYYRMSKSSSPPPSATLSCKFSCIDLFSAYDSQMACCHQTVIRPTGSIAVDTATLNLLISILLIAPRQAEPHPLAAADLWEQWSKPTQQIRIRGRSGIAWRRYKTTKIGTEVVHTVLLQVLDASWDEIRLEYSQAIRTTRLPSCTSGGSNRLDSPLRSATYTTRITSISPSHTGRCTRSEEVRLLTFGISQLLRKRLAYKVMAHSTDFLYAVIAFLLQQKMGSEKAYVF